MLIVSRGYYSVTYLFSYLLLSRCYRVPTQSVVNKVLGLGLGLGLEGQVLGLGLGGQVLSFGLGLEGCGLHSKSARFPKGGGNVRVVI